MTHPRWRTVLLSIAIVGIGGGLISLAGVFRDDDSALRRGSAATYAPPPVVESASDAILPMFQEAVVALHVRDYNGAVIALERVLAQVPELPEANVNMGFAMLGLEHYVEALRYFETALELRAGQVNALYGMAIAYEGLGQLEEAIGAMNSFIHLVEEQDPYRRKAMAAVWEWRERLTRQGSAEPAETSAAADRDGMQE